jgi:uncharacterized protein (DUF924 family)
MTPFWYAGSKEYDALCQNFQEAIRAIGERKFHGEDENWNANLDGKMAQILLCDQLSRNAFRGQDKAFVYDPVALGLARELSQELVDSSAEIEPSKEIILSSIPGEMYPPYLQFIVSPLMHSEELSDHELAVNVLDVSLEKVPPHLREHFENTKKFEMDHKKVVDRFGRYPHRNKMMGRDSTKEELEWLASDDVPGWAKSQ